MDTDIAFCDNCRKDVHYVLKSVPVISTIKNKECKYISFEAYCAECGSNVFVPEIVDANLRVLYNVYYRENGEDCK